MTTILDYNYVVESEFRVSLMKTFLKQRFIRFSSALETFSLNVVKKSHNT